VTISTIIFLFVTGVAIPVLAWMSKKRLDEGLALPRRAFYLEAAVTQLLLLPFALWVAKGVDLELSIALPSDVRSWAGGAILLALALGAVVISWPLTDVGHRERLFVIVPQTRDERIAWTGISFVAGFVEETVYRGVLFALLFKMVGVWWIAAVIAAFLFGLAHLVQGWESTIAIGLFGVAFQYLVLISGTLGVAIVVHFLYDLLVGFSVGIIGQRNEGT